MNDTPPEWIKSQFCFEKENPVPYQTLPDNKGTICFTSIPKIYSVHIMNLAHTGMNAYQSPNQNVKVLYSSLLLQNQGKHGLPTAVSISCEAIDSLGGSEPFISTSNLQLQPIE